MDKHIYISEKELSIEFGVSRDEIKQWRLKAIEVSADYCFQQESKRPKNAWSWFWTDTGKKWLAREMNFEMTKDIIDTVTADANPIEKSGIVFKHDFPNTKLVMVKTASGEKLVAICNDNNLFRKGMQIDIKFDKHGWYVKRNPHPRNNG